MSPRKRAEVGNVRAEEGVSLKDKHKSRGGRPGCHSSTIQRVPDMDTGPGQESSEDSRASYASHTLPLGPKVWGSSLSERAPNPLTEDRDQVREEEALLDLRGCLTTLTPAGV